MLKGGRIIALLGVIGVFGLGYLAVQPSPHFHSSNSAEGDRSLNARLSAGSPDAPDSVAGQFAGFLNQLSPEQRLQMGVAGEGSGDPRLQGDYKKSPLSSYVIAQLNGKIGGDLPAAFVADPVSGVKEVRGVLEALRAPSAEQERTALMEGLHELASRSPAAQQEAVAVYSDILNGKSGQISEWDAGSVQKVVSEFAQLSVDSGEQKAALTRALELIQEPQARETVQGMLRHLEQAAP